MASDCRILGIEDTQDVETIKSAFRRRVKELHPDLAEGGDPFQRHYLFVAVCEAYRRLLACAAEAGPAPREGAATSAAPPAGARGGEAGAGARGKLAAHADPAYVYYRTGMRIFMSIHPSSWNLDPGMLNTKIAGEEGEQEIIRTRLLDLVKLFPRAYWYFGMVVHEYPGSDWEHDAREKMRLIEERMVRYRRILESFSSWNVDPSETARRYRETFARHRGTGESITEEERRNWKE